MYKAWATQWCATGMLSLAEHWHGRRALSNHVCAHSVTSMWHVFCLQLLARACDEQSRSTSVLHINHVIQIPTSLTDTGATRRLVVNQREVMTRLLELLYVLNIKRNIYYTHIVVFWHISNIPPMISQGQISCNTHTFYIAALFVKYCYATVSWLL